ncbi:MAG TPA: triose-phosphate isomerase [Acidilobales archaeon]|nr:triose-phosphate isomerase [Acidilobales archaeon]
MKEPILAINFKAYSTAFGRTALEIAKLAERAAKEYGLTVIILPPLTEISRLVQEVEIPVFAQHVDPVNLGAHTGHVTAEMVKEVGASGIMINHSEKRLRIDEINFLIKKAKDLGLETLVCADTPETSAAISALKPELLAVEPPELIGTGIAVSKAKPEVITNTVSYVRKINKEVIILTGAGISSYEDVAAAIRLGTSGVLVASAIMKAKNPGKVIDDMAKAAVEAFSKE